MLPQTKVLRYYDTSTTSPACLRLCWPPSHHKRSNHLRPGMKQRIMKRKTKRKQLSNDLYEHGRASEIHPKSNVFVFLTTSIVRFCSHAALSMATSKEECCSSIAASSVVACTAWSEGRIWKNASETIGTLFWTQWMAILIIFPDIL